MQESEERAAACHRAQDSRGEGAGLLRRAVFGVRGKERGRARVDAGFKLFSKTIEFSHG